MNTAELLADAYGRVKEVVHDAVDGLTADELADRLDPEANSVAWLVWHLTRVQDDHVAEVAGQPQTWTEGGWEKRFGLPFGTADTGYGHTPDEVAAVRVASADLLTGYYDAVHEQTLRFVRGLADGDLDRIVDRRWNPPVTLGVRLISVISDDLQHAGQAAVLRGLLMRRRG
jgi:uncharacterized damage-inducible protein DinB